MLQCCGLHTLASVFQKLLGEASRKRKRLERDMSRGDAHNAHVPHCRGKARDAMGARRWQSQQNYAFNRTTCAPDWNIAAANAQARCLRPLLSRVAFSSHPSNEPPDQGWLHWGMRNVPKPKLQRQCRQMQFVLTSFDIVFIGHRSRV